MSKTRLLSALAASFCVLVAACWLVTNTFPLAAAPQVVSDAPGVTVDVGSATLMHRTPVAYPEAARGKRVQGSVAVEVMLDGSGNVADARVVSGPEDLRKAVLQSVLLWHFARESAGAKRTITVNFDAPAGAAATQSSVSLVPPPPPPPPPPSAGVKGGVAAMKTNRTLKSVNVLGVSDTARAEILSRLNLRAGSVITGEEAWGALRSLRDYDEHLTGNVTYTGADEIVVTVVAPSPNATPKVQIAAATSDVEPLRVGGNLQSTKLIRQPRPVYPAEAKEARIQGVVKLKAIIAKDGTVRQLEVLSGHPVLVAAALEAVKEWVYETTLLNGAPVEVQTQVDVNFTLSQ